MIVNYCSLDDCAEAAGTVVVIDVLRAFTCTAFALGAGVDSIFLVAEVEEAFALRRQMPDALLMGEVGSKRVPGFDFGNSPAEIDGLELYGRCIIQRTSNGTQGMVRSVNAQTILAGSFCCAEATVDFIRLQNPSTLSFVITGLGPDGRGDEDVALADYITARLRGEQPDPGPYLERVRRSVIGRRFPDPNWPDFPPDDLPCCTALDRFNFAMPVERRDGMLVMTRGRGVQNAECGTAEVVSGNGSRTTHYASAQSARNSPLAILNTPHPPRLSNPSEDGIDNGVSFTPIQWRVIMADMTAQKLLLYVGTYTRNGSEGIYRFRMDPVTGTLTPAGVTSGVKNPSFLAIHPDLHTLYAVNEVSDFEGQPGGGLNAFHIDPNTGDLTFLNQQPTYGEAPCYVSVDATGQAVLVANYTGGNLAVFPVQADGSLGPASDRVQHEGSGPNPKRQEGPHAHSINVTPDNRFALAADLGLDKVMVYRLDPARGTLSPHDPPYAAVPAGGGPRHFDFHPSGRFLYVINEMGSTVTVFAFDAQAATFEPLQTISTLPGGWEGSSSCADIHVSPSGRFLYGSNRGHDSIAIYAIDETYGSLSVVGHTPTGGRTPRNFAIDPTGAFLLAANQDTHSIVVFSIDRESGTLEPTGIEASVPMPVCLTFYPRAMG